MDEIAFLENPLNVYLLKQNEFKIYIKEIQHSLNTKVYIKQGKTIEEFVKSKWNISKTQAYRYLLCAKTIDQLEEFEIQPNYERLCRTLNKYAKTAQQMKLLWGMILYKINKKVDLITSSLVTKTWNELCKDKKYSSICNFEDSILTKIENTIKQHSKKSKQNQLKSYINNNTKSYNSIPNNSYLISPEISSQTSECSSQCIIIPSNDCIYNENVEINQLTIENQNTNNENFLSINNNNYYESQISNPLSPYSSHSSLSPLSSILSLSPTTQNNEINCSLPTTQNNEIICSLPTTQNNEINCSLPTTQNNEINCSLPLNEYQYQNENQIIPIYYPIPTQQNIIYY